jgi:pyruvate dehydrogenase kinase 2/3/4
MRRMLVSRISRRVLAEHHIALSNSISENKNSDPHEHVGIIYTNLSVKDSIVRCKNLLREVHDAEDALTPVDRLTFPEVLIDGHTETRFSYIKVSALPISWCYPNVDLCRSTWIMLFSSS